MFHHQLIIIVLHILTAKIDKRYTVDIVNNIQIKLEERNSEVMAKSILINFRSTQQSNIKKTEI